MRARLVGKDSANLVPGTCMRSGIQKYQLRNRLCSVFRIAVRKKMKHRDQSSYFKRSLQNLVMFFIVQYDVIFFYYLICVVRAYGKKKK